MRLEQFDAIVLRAVTNRRMDLSAPLRPIGAAGDGSPTVAARLPKMAKMAEGAQAFSLVIFGNVGHLRAARYRNTGRALSNKNRMLQQGRSLADGRWRGRPASPRPSVALSAKRGISRLRCFSAPLPKVAKMPEGTQRFSWPSSATLATFGPIPLPFRMSG